MKGLIDAAERGDPQAMLRVAGCFADQANAGYHKGRAIRWYQNAARAGVVEAMYELASQYFAGDGVPLDLGVGRRWLERAYAADHLVKSPSVPTLAVRERVLALFTILEAADDRSGVGRT